MNEATTYVQEQLNGGPNFQPTWMIVAQWDRVHPDPHGADSHEGVSEEYLSKVKIQYINVFCVGASKAPTVLYLSNITPE